jgi:hypothetical protein
MQIKTLGFTHPSRCNNCRGRSKHRGIVMLTNSITIEHWISLFLLVKIVVYHHFVHAISTRTATLIHNIDATIASKDSWVTSHYIHRPRKQNSSLMPQEYCIDKIWNKREPKMQKYKFLSRDFISIPANTKRIVQPVRRRVKWSSIVAFQRHLLSRGLD